MPTTEPAKTEKHNIKCIECGKFISMPDIEHQFAKYHFIPDSQFGPEESYWICKKCKN